MNDLEHNLSKIGVPSQWKEIEEPLIIEVHLKFVLEKVKDI